MRGLERLFASGFVIVFDEASGKVTDKTTQHGHGTLSTFGIGAKWSEQQWRGVIRQLLSLGHLQSEGEYNTLVLTDSEMPDRNGFEFAETIRGDAHLGEVPIIGLSSLISPAAIERGRQAGFHDYVAKFDRPGLIAALKEQTAHATGLGRAA